MACCGGRRIARSPMAEESFYRLLEHPQVYRLSQLLLAPGAEKKLTERLGLLKGGLDDTGPILDVGCGPESWLSKVDIHPVGLDISYQYSMVYHDSGNPAITGSATDLPFAAGTFGSAWSIGVLHHLPDEAAKEAIKEMLRVCRPTGHIIIMDAVLPRNSWVRPVAAIIRRMDRGEHMRDQLHLESLFPDASKWNMKRFTYAATGLEMLECFLTV